MRRRGRVSVVLVEFSPSGGLFQFALQLGEGLARRGCAVELWTGPDPEVNSREPQCRIRAVLPTWHPFAGEKAPEWWRRLRRVVRGGQLTCAWLVLVARVLATRPRVVLFSTWRFPLDAVCVRLLRAVAPDVRLGIVAHEPRPLVEQPGDDGSYKSGGLLNMTLRAAWRSMDVVFVLGENTREELLRNWPVQCCVTVIPHGDEAVFLEEGVSPVGDTGELALFFGTITGHKGLDDLLDAWPAVRGLVPEARLVIAGPVSADVDAGELSRRVTALPGVSFQPGYVPMGEVPNLMGAARCVVLPYKRSSQSGVAHLAYTFGRPVVATAVGDVPRVVCHGETGIIVPPEDPPALARGVSSLLANAAEASRLGANGRAGLAESATWDDVAQLVEDTLWLK